MDNAPAFGLAMEAEGYPHPEVHRALCPLFRPAHALKSVCEGIAAAGGDLEFMKIEIDAGLP
jgi:hypothetical protein